MIGKTKQSRTLVPAAVSWLIPVYTPWRASYVDDCADTKCLLTHRVSVSLSASLSLSLSLPPSLSLSLSLSPYLSLSPCLCLPHHVFVSLTACLCLSHRVSLSLSPCLCLSHRICLSLPSCLCLTHRVCLSRRVCLRLDSLLSGDPDTIFCFMALPFPTMLPIVSWRKSCCSCCC